MGGLIKAASVLAKKLAKKLAKEFIKQKGKDMASESKIIKVVLIVALSIVIAIPIIVFAVFGNLICTFADCDADTGKKEDVISISMLEDISSRMDKLRIEVNQDSDEPGDNFGRYTVKITNNEGKTDKEEGDNPKEAMVEQAASSSKYPVGDYNTFVTGNKLNINLGILERLAAVGESYGKTININSGWRSSVKQKELYDGYISGKPGYNLAAAPGKSAHEIGMAIDTNSQWLKALPSSSLAPFGLVKNVPGENWHITAVEQMGVVADNRKYVTVNGYGITQGVVEALAAVGIPFDGTISVGGEGTAEASTEGFSESYIHLLALGQADELDMIFFDKDELDKQEEKGTNLGKTWTLAKALKKDIKSGTYPDRDVNSRAKDEKWGTRQYVKLARWEIQKCFLMGDESKAGFFESIFGGPTPCGNIARLAGDDIVPGKLQGVISKTTTKTICAETKDGKCVKTEKVTTVKYDKVEELLYMYEELSLFKDKKEFKPVMKDILETLFERFAAPQTLDNGMLAPPTFIAPLEEGTYQVDTTYGSKLPDGTIAKGTFLKVNRLTPIYSSIAGKVEGAYNDSKGSNTILISHPTYGYVEYKGVSEMLVKKGDSIQQGQLIGSVQPDPLLEFRVCTKANVKNPKPTCEDSTDPSSGDNKITFTNNIDEEKSKKRVNEYAKWKEKGGVIIMPGFSNISTLGQMSAKYESSGDPGKCVHNLSDPGGLSCGSYQIAKNPGTLGTFITYLKSNYPTYYKQLAMVPQNLASFGPAWRSTYDADNSGFTLAQHNFIGETHYVDIVNKVKKQYGFDANTRGRAVQEMFWSYSVQHRNNTVKAFGSSVGNDWKAMSDKEIITKMYDYRISTWSCCTPRFQSEKKDALALLAQE